MGKKLGETFLLVPQQHSTTMAARMSADMDQGLMKGGLVDRRQEDSPIYYLMG